MRKVLVANRGEIAVRIIRAARDAGLASVAAYADQDASALFVSLADEAFALHGVTGRGATPATTYLDGAKILKIAERSGADAIHPGYGFLAENADFAAAVIAAGLTWIGPPPEAIRALGDKVQARHIAQRVGAPLVPGTADPVSGVGEVLDFVAQHGLPIAIKAAFGGGGRGLKVARTAQEIPELYESAVREATAAFGRGECFVERYLDRPRHVETQCLADQHGHVVVISTRDCSLQRRHQKLVEEAPAPFLTEDQLERLYASSKAILAEAGYVGAGTCEFLVGQDGDISFLEVNTRLQVEHPVSEEVTGIDLVQEMFRIAHGEPIGYDDPTPRGHAIEFRINAEDPARDFLPTPGTLSAWVPPAGPGVRVDEGYRAGMTVSGSFDSLVAKIIVTGADRQQALARSRRALAELVIEGVPTVVPFHRAVLDDPALVAADGLLGVHTRWIETEFRHDLSAAPLAQPAPGPSDSTGSTGPAGSQGATRTVVVEVDGRRLEVVLPGDLFGVGSPGAEAQGAGLPGAGTDRAARARRRSGRRDTRRVGLASGVDEVGAVAAPMHGTVTKVAVRDGDSVEQGDVILVLEAMKMEHAVTAPTAGTVSDLTATRGDTVNGGYILCRVQP